MEGSVTAPECTVLHRHWAQFEDDGEDKDMVEFEEGLEDQKKKVGGV